MGMRQFAVATDCPLCGRVFFTHGMDRHLKACAVKQAAISLGRKGGKVGGLATTPAKQRAARKKGVPAKRATKSAGVR